MSTPNYSQMVDEIWGWPDEFGSGDWFILTTANNIVTGLNTPYSASDFLAIYPKFGGAPTAITATTDGTTDVLTAVSSIQGLAKGQLVTGPGIADGSVVVSIAGSTVTLSAATTAAGTLVALNVYTAPLIPLAVLNAYIYLATNSIFQARWCEMWTLAMALFIAHYATLWMQGEASSPNTTAAQAAASGLAIGIKTSKAVQDVSVGMQALDLDGWGSFQLTIYGQQLATWANAVGSGMMLIY
jgi:hypothetical protein